MRLAPDAPIETFSTPRRLTARIGRMPERQEDLDETVTGPPVSAAFNAAGEPTPAGARLREEAGRRLRGARAREDREGRIPRRAKKHVRGKSTVDALPELLGGLLRDLAFPKQMHWDAMLEDGRGELVFGRPIRWLLYLYGGRVVPFTIARIAERGRRAGAGGDDRRGDLRPSVPGHQRARRTLGQGAHLRRLPRAAAGALRHPRSLRAPRSDRARARGQGAQAGRPRPPARARGAARRGRRPGRVSRASSPASSIARSSSCRTRS